MDRFKSLQKRNVLEPRERVKSVLIILCHVYTMYYLMGSVF